MTDEAKSTPHYELGKARPEPYFRIQAIANDYITQIVGTDELATLISPIISEIDEKQVHVILERMKPFTEGSLSEDFENTLDQFTDELRSVASFTRKAHGNAEDGSAEEVNFEPKKFSIKSEIAPQFIDTISRLIRHVKFGSRVELVRRSLLINSVSAFELLFEGLARAVLNVNKAALNDSGQTFTLKDLLNFSSIEDARTEIIDRRLASLLYEGLDGWDAWLGKVAGGVQMQKLPLDWPRTKEVFARRNIAVHANCVVSDQYLKYLHPGYSPIPVKGERLQVDDDYLHQSLSHLVTLGVMLSAAVWKQLYPRAHDSLGNWLSKVQIDLLSQSIWQPVINASQFSRGLNLARSTETRIYINGLVARKELGGLDSVRDEVERWDVSGLSVRFEHAKNVLLENGRSISQVRKLLKSGDINLYEIATNPLYRHMSSEEIVAAQGSGE